MGQPLLEKIIYTLWGDRSDYLGDWMFKKLREQMVSLPTPLLEHRKAAAEIKEICRKLQKISDQQCITIYLSGRDCLLYHVQLRKWGVKHRYNPTVNRVSTILTGTDMKKVGLVAFFDTGFSGTIYKSMRDMNRISHKAPMFLHSHQDLSPDVSLSPVSKGESTRRIVLDIENYPSPWPMITGKDEYGWIDTQPFFKEIQEVNSPSELHLTDAMVSHVTNTMLAREFYRILRAQIEA